MNFHQGGGSILLKKFDKEKKGAGGGGGGGELAFILYQYSRNLIKSNLHFQVLKPLCLAKGH